MRIFESILDQIDVSDDNRTMTDEIIRQTNNRTADTISPDEWQFYVKIELSHIYVFLDDNAPEYCIDNCTEVLNNSRIVRSHSAVKICVGSDKMLPRAESTQSEYPFLSPDDAPTHELKMYLCFGVNFSNQTTTLKVITLFRSITQSIEKYFPAQGVIEVIGPDGKGSWDTFGITHTLKTNQCTVHYLRQLAEYVENVRQWRRGKKKKPATVANTVLTQNIMDLNMILFKDEYGTGPYSQIVSLPGINSTTISKIADLQMAVRYRKVTSWKPDELLDFDIDKFRAMDDFNNYWKESSWQLTPVDMHFGDKPFGYESFCQDDVLNQEMWDTITNNIHRAHLKDFILGVRLTKNDPTLYLIMYAGVVKRPLTNYGYSAVYLCIKQYLGYYLSGDLINFCDMLDECIGITNDERETIISEIKNMPVRNYNGTLEKYCREWGKGLLPTTPPDPYIK